MKSKTFLIGLAVLALAATVLFEPLAQASRDWTQTLVVTLDTGVAAKGAGVLQTGEVSTLSSTIAGTRTKVVTAPTSGSTYLRGIFIEKSATSTGSVIVSQGTGTNCGTNNTVLLSLTAASGQTFPFGYQAIGILVPAGKDLCLATEGANTSVRALAE